MLRAIFDNLGRVSACRFSLLCPRLLGKRLSVLGSERSPNAQDVKNVGFSGGAACNQILAQLMRETVENAGLRFFVHEAVPAGDGGVSFGQAVVAGFSKF